MHISRQENPLTIQFFSMYLLQRISDIHFQK
jgi:hypothetical protein